jgi:hypothetical protein
MAYPSTRGWGPPGLAETVTLDCPGPFPLHCAPAAAHVLQQVVDGVAEIRGRHGMSPVLAYGCYNKRFISGTTTWSNHSWGIAVDLNAPTNPYSYAGTTDYGAAAQREVRTLCDSLHMRWGLDYVGKKDAMHFEFMGTPAEAARVTATPSAPVVLLRDTEVGKAQVMLVQRAVNYTDDDVDGYWGETTEHGVNKVIVCTQGHPEAGGGAVAESQLRVGAAPDGIWGPRSEEALIATVAKLQTAWGVDPDGDWGPVTAAAHQANRDAYYRG